MKKHFFLLALIIIVCFQGCGDAESHNLPQNDAASENESDNVTEAAWSTDAGSIFYQDNKVAQLEDVLPETDNFIDCYSVNDNYTYLAYYSSEAKIKVKSCDTNGNIKELGSLDYTSFGGAGTVYICFIDESEGYLLYCSDPAAGLMTKVLYKTNDGGMTYGEIGDISDSIKNYPTDIAFVNNEKGLILTNYHGTNSYAYLTGDGGKTWNDMDIDKNKSCNYIEGVSLNKNGTDWELVLREVYTNGDKCIKYHADDEWEFN